MTLKDKAYLNENICEWKLKTVDEKERHLKLDYKEVKKAILKDNENLYEIIGRLSGLKLTEDISLETQTKINEIVCYYLRKKTEIFGNWEE